jgi:hypothetical protein
MIEYKVGAQVWFVPRYGGPGQELTVTKVARKWVTLGNGRHIDRYRVELGSDQVDGGEFSSPGKVWESREVWDAHNKLEQVWDATMEELRKRYYRLPEGVSVEHIQQIRRILGYPELS